MGRNVGYLASAYVLVASLLASGLWFFYPMVDEVDLAWVAVVCAFPLAGPVGAALRWLAEQYPGETE